MNGLRLAVLALAVTALNVTGVQAQFYGGGFNGGGFNGSGMGNFAPPHSIGGYYPMPYSTVFPGFRGGFVSPGFYGYGPGFGPYGFGYPGNGFGAYGMVPSVNMVQQPSQTIVQSQTVVVPAAPAAAPSPTGQDIKLICPKTATGPLSYSLNGTPYTIQPGYSQNFRDDRTWRLEFLRAGEGTQVVAYTLRPGTYRFGNGAEGWDLRQVVPTQPGDLPPAPQPTPFPATTPTPIIPMPPT